MPRPRTLLAAAAVWLSVHAAVWLVVAASEPTRYPCRQGVFVAAAVALDGALRSHGDFRKRALRFAASGAASFALFALWPAYQYFATGEATKFLWAQSQFGPLAATASCRTSCTGSLRGARGSSRHAL